MKETPAAITITIQQSWAKPTPIRWDHQPPMNDERPVRFSLKIQARRTVCKNTSGGIQRDASWRAHLLTTRPPNIRTHHRLQLLGGQLHLSHPDGTGEAGVHLRQGRSTTTRIVSKAGQEKIRQNPLYDDTNTTPLALKKLRAHHPPPKSQRPLSEH